jgi:chromosome segregation ATPase
MARTGIGKSEVQRARDRLLARHTHPSIDAVRAELGHTGSKTTIQRYLRELEEEEGSGLDRTAAVSEAIQELVQRLAARLGEEADAQVVALRQHFDAQLRERDEQLAQQRREAEALAGQLQQTEMMLQAEQATHATARQALAEAHTAQERLTQQVADLTDRLADNEAHRQSLEEKHQHAREALEHYRQSAKEQREQELRRHEQQVQLLQVDVRTLNQTLIVKQNELTQLHQERARIAAEMNAARKALQRSELDGERLSKANSDLQRHVSELESSGAILSERLQYAELASKDAKTKLSERSETLRQAAAAKAALETELIQLRAQVAVQTDVLDTLKSAFSRQANRGIPEDPMAD